MHEVLFEFLDYKHLSKTKYVFLNTPKFEIPYENCMEKLYFSKIATMFTFFLFMTSIYLRFKDNKSFLKAHL